MSQLWTSNPVNIKDVKNVPIPKQTETYVPVPYNDYINTLIDMGEEHLKGFTFENRQYGLAREGNFLFGLHTYRNSDKENTMAVGFRTSYNKLLANAVALGSRVEVCENLMLTGQIVIMRKHTKNVWEDLENLVYKAFNDAEGNWNKALTHREFLRRFPINDDEAYQFLGKATGRGVLRLRQFKKSLDEWKNPTHKEHGKGTAWTLYQATTEALKSTPIHTYMEKHRGIQRLFESRYNLEQLDAAQTELVAKA